MGLTRGIYIITGIMASGKSTIAQLLAEKTIGSVHIRGDIFRKMIVSGRVEITNPPTEEATKQLHLRYKLAAQVAEEYYNAGFTVIIQDNYLGKEVLYFLNCFTISPVYLITLCPSVTSVEERESVRCKTGYGEHWDVKTLQNVLLNENPKIGLWIDSTKQTPERTAAEIISKYQSEARIK
jgi:chloramphenicol 3-O-phosphotransferase